MSKKHTKLSRKKHNKSRKTYKKHTKSRSIKHKSQRAGRIGNPNPNIPRTPRPPGLPLLPIPQPLNILLPSSPEFQWRHQSLRVGVQYAPEHRPLRIDHDQGDFRLITNFISDAQFDRMDNRQISQNYVHVPTRNRGYEGRTLLLAHLDTSRDINMNNYSVDPNNDHISWPNGVNDDDYRQYSN